eukprot:Pgem_evm1s5551
MHKLLFRSSFKRHCEVESILYIIHFHFTLYPTILFNVVLPVLTWELPVIPISSVLQN